MKIEVEGKIWDEKEEGMAEMETIALFPNNLAELAQMNLASIFQEHRSNCMSPALSLRSICSAPPTLWPPSFVSIATITLLLPHTSVSIQAHLALPSSNTI